MVNLLPCPFCGGTPELPSGDGTQYDIWCGCGKALSSVQICDLMTIEERASDEFINFRYGEEFVDRAKNEAILRCNDRVQGANKTDKDIADEQLKYAYQLTVHASQVPSQQVKLTWESPDFIEEETQRLIERLTSLKGDAVKVSTQAKLIGHWNTDFRYPCIELIEGTYRSDFVDGTPIYAGSVPA